MTKRSSEKDTFLYYFDQCLAQLGTVPYQHGVLISGGVVQEIYDIDYASTFDPLIILLDAFLLFMLLGGGVLILAIFHACDLAKQSAYSDI